MIPSSLDHVVVNVSDVNRACDFYERVLGAEIVEFGADLCILTETPIDGVVRHLGALAVEIVVGPVERTGATGSILSVYIRDPDGSLIEISNPMAG